MQQIFQPKWGFCCFIIVLQIYMPQASEPQNQETMEKAAVERVDWPGLLTDLRDSWQSPLSYLQKRGYLPPGSESLLEQKLNELRGIKVDEHKEGSNLDEFGEKAAENVEEETNAFSDASGSKAIGFLHPSVLSSADSGVQSTNEYPNAAIVTYASRQQQPQEAFDSLLKEFSLQEHDDTDTETDPEFEEGSDSFQNNIANACAKRPHKGGSNSKWKHKCKSKPKSESKPQSKPGFFQRLKKKLASIFTKSKGVDAKKELIKKPALTPDYANYFVKYLAHRDMAAGSNTLSVNDINAQYAGKKSGGDWETDGKGLYRRDQGAKDLSFRDVYNEDFNDKKTKLKSSTCNKFESTDLANQAAGSKDFTLKEFPFKDFNLGDLNVKRLATKDTTSQQEDGKILDLKNFSSKDKELNQIVHSLAEQQSSEKDSFDLKFEKSEPTKDANLKVPIIAKDTGSELEEFRDSVQKDVKDFCSKDLVPNFDNQNEGNVGKNTEASFKELEPVFDDKNMGNAGKNTEAGNWQDLVPTFDDKIVGNAGKSLEVVSSKENGLKDDGMSDFVMPNFNVKKPGIGTKSDTNYADDLSGFDFSMPDLGAKSLTSNSKDATSKVVGAKDFGYLGMPSLKMKILESNAAEASANVENQKDYDQPSVAGFEMKSPGTGISDQISKERNFNAFDRLQLDVPNVFTKGLNGDANHVAVKGANVKHFEIGELATKLDEDNLDLDRQFTQQVLKKIMRSSAQNSEREKD